MKKTVLVNNSPYIQATNKLLLVFKQTFILIYQKPILLFLPGVTLRHGQVPVGDYLVTWGLVCSSAAYRRKDKTIIPPHLLPTYTPLTRWSPTLVAPPASFGEIPHDIYSIRELGQGLGSLGGHWSFGAKFASSIPFWRFVKGNQQAA